MMTSEQIQQLRRDEAAMMAEWSASSVQPSCFNTDGIVDYERWAALPDGKHIVVLLKETNALSGSLVDFLSHGGSETYRWMGAGVEHSAKCWTLELEKILQVTGRL